MLCQQCADAAAAVAGTAELILLMLVFVLAAGVVPGCGGGDGGVQEEMEAVQLPPGAKNFCAEFEIKAKVG